MREVCAYGKYIMDIGNRQKGRYSNNILNINYIDEDKEQVLQKINQFRYLDEIVISYFGDEKSDEKFLQIILDNNI